MPVSKTVDFHPSLFGHLQFLAVGAFALHSRDGRANSHSKNLALTISNCNTYAPQGLNQIYISLTTRGPTFAGNCDRLRIATVRAIRCFCEHAKLPLGLP